MHWSTPWACVARSVPTVLYQNPHNLKSLKSNKHLLGPSESEDSQEEDENKVSAPRCLNHLVNVYASGKQKKVIVKHHTVRICWSMYGRSGGCCILLSPANVALPDHSHLSCSCSILTGSALKKNLGCISSKQPSLSLWVEPPFLIVSIHTLHLPVWEHWPNDTDAVCLSVWFIVIRTGVITSMATICQGLTDNIYWPVSSTEHHLRIQAKSSHLHAGSTAAMSQKQ